MKKIFLVLGILISFYAHSQNTAVKTATIVVKGNCEQCKKRIENAADIKGVKICDWNEKTQMATVTYNSEKVSLEQIEQAIAKSGHEAGSVKGNDAAYNKLPGCCKYRDNKCEQKK